MYKDRVLERVESIPQSPIESDSDKTEYMKLPEKCELSNLFYKAAFHFRLDFRQTRDLNLATVTRLEIVRLEVVDSQVF